LFFYIIEQKDSKPTVKKCSSGAFLGRSVAETLPLYVDITNEVGAFSLMTIFCPCQ
jgi:hypothetical protein